jgi:ribosomal protein S18 acetylase RimI-like enzyme
MVGVYADFRGLGIGKKLTQQCIALATQSGERIIALHTSEIMHAARATYEQLGFTIVRELPLYFGIRYWLYSLVL